MSDYYDVITLLFTVTFGLLYGQLYVMYAIKNDIKVEDGILWYISFVFIGCGLGLLISSINLMEVR